MSAVNEGDRDATEFGLEETFAHHAGEEVPVFLKHTEMTKALRMITFWNVADCTTKSDCNQLQILNTEGAILDQTEICRKI